jgi:hypothetical protein
VAERPTKVLRYHDYGLFLTPTSVTRLDKYDLFGYFFEGSSIFLEKGAQKWQHFGLLFCQAIFKNFHLNMQFQNIV